MIFPRVEDNVSKSSESKIRN